MAGGARAAAKSGKLLLFMGFACLAFIQVFLVYRGGERPASGSKPLGGKVVMMQKRQGQQRIQERILQTTQTQKAELQAAAPEQLPQKNMEQLLLQGSSEIPAAIIMPRAISSVLKIDHQQGGIVEAECNLLSRSVASSSNLERMQKLR